MTELTFASLKLSDALTRALTEVGYSAPTAVQAAAFEPIASGRDIIVQSRTGSGKTAAFALPLLDRVVKLDGGVQALVLCPTRELALQVAGEFGRLGKHAGIKVAAVYGGASMSAQIAALESGAQVVAGTPGRVLDHLRRGTLNVSNLRAITLDEGDEMLSMGFAEEIHAILEHLPKHRQTLLFSATMPEAIQRIAHRHMKSPETVALSSDQIAPELLTHLAYLCSQGSRLKDLARVLEQERPAAALIFCNTRSETEMVSRALQAQGLAAEYLNGDMAQSDRERVMGALRSGRVTYLVATDVAARGIDIPHLSHVVNYGFPESAEAYVHRTGRTGRAGKAGIAISMIGPQDIGNLYLLRLTYGIRPIERSLPSLIEEKTRRENDRLQLLIEAAARAPAEEAVAIARRLLTHDDAERVIASLIDVFFDIGRRRELEQPVADVAPAAPPPAPTPAPAPTPRKPARKAPAAVAAVAPTPGAAPVVAVAAPAVVAPVPAEVPPSEPVAAPVEEPAVAPPSEVGAPVAEESAGQPAEARRARSPRKGEVERVRRVEVRHGEKLNDEDGDDEGMEELRLAVGRRDGVRAGEVARMLRDVVKLTKRDIGRISVRDRMTLVNLRPEVLSATIEALKDMTFNDRAVSPEKGRSAGISSNEESDLPPGEP